MRKVKPCRNCPDCRKVYAQGNWSFHGCYHEPYHGKWIAEIEKCPKEEHEHGGSEDGMDTV